MSATDAQEETTMSTQNPTHETHFPRLVRLAKLLGAKLPAPGGVEVWRDAVESIYDRAGGRGSVLLEQTFEGFRALIDAMDAERQANDKRLIPVARARYAKEAAALRARVDGILYDRELQLENAKLTIQVSDREVVYGAACPARIVDEVLAERGLRCDHSQRVGTADEARCGIVSFTAPLV